MKSRNDKKKRANESAWASCDQCRGIVSQTALKSNSFVCPHCGYHYPLSPWGWIERLADEFEEWDPGLTSVDPLAFEVASRSYRRSLEKSRVKTGLNEAVVTGRAELGQRSLALAVMSFDFIGGSMGSAVGERITRAIEKAVELKIPLVTVSASGGARMQEGIFSLMQMAKTAAAVGRLHEAGRPFISVLTHPTTGGVAASFAFLADIILAEPRALIGFAGPRVIEETIKQKLPKGFQTAEFLVEHGMIDRVVARPEVRETIVKIIDILGSGRGARGPTKKKKKAKSAKMRIEDPV